MAIGINLMLGFTAFLSLSLFSVLGFSVAVAVVVAVAGVAIEFLLGLNFLFDATAALTGLLSSLPEKLLLIFFFCFSTNCAALRNTLKLLCLGISNEVEMENFSVSLNISIC